MRQGYEVYEAYLDGHEAEIESGEPFVLETRELATMVRMVVKAQVAKPPHKLTEGQTLWVRNYKEAYLEEPWQINILEELDEDEFQPIRGDIARGEEPTRNKMIY